MGIRQYLSVSLMTFGWLGVAQAESGIGAPYGARDPMTCEKGELAAKVPTPELVKKSIRCFNERRGDKYSMVPGLRLLGDIDVEIAPKGRPYHPGKDYRFHNPDVSAPVYAIEGSLTRYQCRRLRPSGEGRGMNCRAEIMPKASGVCYKNVWGDWNCHLLGVETIIKDGVPPPQ